MDNETLHKLIKNSRGRLNVKDVITTGVSILIALGSLITAWVNLNNGLVRIETRVSMMEQYNNQRMTELKSLDAEIQMRVKQAVENQTKSNDRLQEKVNDLENTLSHLYQKTIKNNKSL
jgi:chaperonin cofactor prefoldin